MFIVSIIFYGHRFIGGATIRATSRKHMNDILNFIELHSGATLDVCALLIPLCVAIIMIAADNLPLGDDHVTDAD